MELSEFSRAAGPISPEAFERLARFVDALLRENTIHNLTALRRRDDVWKRHVVESLQLAEPLRERPTAQVVDLGTGGGVPGLPLAISMPAVRFTLVDSVRKKCAAVERIVAAVGIANARVVCGRGEVLGGQPEHHGRYDALVARAVAPLTRLLGYAAGFVEAGGRLLLAKSPDVRDELAAAAGTARRLGLRWIETRAMHNPLGGEWSLVIYAKSAT
ncbi:MAG: Ribosomal RNA small subunit methyltransferase G [Phycisphaerae bacterium]|nr:Ribosomal RNA small subunit methyltransferase G [Phycisphaerae bacterium]